VRESSNEKLDIEGYVFGMSMFKSRLGHLESGLVDVQIDLKRAQTFYNLKFTSWASYT
jgi:hypothetical protein